MVETPKGTDREDSRKAVELTADMRIGKAGEMI